MKLDFVALDKLLHVLDLTFQFSAELFQLIHSLDYTYTDKPKIIENGKYWQTCTKMIKIDHCP